MTTPSTTESATNRIDLDRLSAALTAAGWTEHHDHHWGEGTHRYGRDDRRIQFGDSGLQIWRLGMYPRDLYGPIDLLDPIWQHALDLIREHTTHTPARSHAAEEEAVVRVAFTVDDAMMASNACRNCGEHAIAEVLDVLIHDALSARSHDAGTPGEGE